MMKYFKLFEECYLVNGDKKDAIYNILSGDIFSVESDEKKLLVQTENNISIVDACKEAGINICIAKTFFDKLIDYRLGSYSETPITAEKLELLPKWMEKMFFKLPPVINRSTISLGNQCNLECDFCGSKNKTNKLKCLTCTGNESNEIDFIELEKAYQIIDLLVKYECTELYLKGGNLLLNWNILKYIIDYSLKSGIKNVVLNLVSSIEEIEVIEYLRKNNISLMIQKYITEDYDIQNIINDIKKYEGINHMHLFLADYKIKNYVFNFYNLLIQNNIKNIMFDFIVPSELNLVPPEYIKDLSTLQRVSIESLSINKKYNPCFYKSCHFDNIGNIYPCSGLLDFKYGDIDNIANTFKEENLNTFWKFNKDSLPKCKLCELRYACNDCRGLTYSLTGDLYENIVCMKK
ncbi:hypothetical protein NX821_003204 (plasmid) [Clostridium septicum]|uniref:hypothetical protein n=1 Tax=Clostridium septicum TaxID=1504 RepID=UPI0032170195